jgi:CheY-like chemotaxis protein
MDTGLRAVSGSSLEANEPAAGTSDAREITILYIEDNPANLRLMAQILLGFERVRLLTAERPEIGIELALEHRPDLVLLDINLPGMSGYEVNDILKASDALANVPVIAVTANAMPDDIDRGRQAGFSDYITKPLNLKQFNTALHRALRYLDA